MGGYRLKLRLIALLFFAVTTLITYVTLKHASFIFPQWEMNKNEFLGPPLHSPNHGSNIQKSHETFVFKQMILDNPSRKPEVGRQNHLENIPTFHQKAGRSKCNTSVTILAPSMRPFQAWREYKQLLNEFSEQSTQLSNTDQRSLHLECPRQLCNVDIQVTTDEVYLKTTNAVIVNMFPQIFKKNLLSFLSHLRQILNPQVHWFFYGVESPQMMTFWDPNIAEIQYHHSITYHSEADLQLPYGKYLSNHSDEMVSPERDWSANKTALIAWMASNCNNTFWPRHEFVSELKKHILVDMYGACGTLTCLPALSEKCTNLMTRYKFYLALENAECDDYITEKVWTNGLLQGAVPVVYGGRKESYERLLPPKSFIHISDFDSAEQLAAYLQFLHFHKSMYNMYHAWRNYGSFKVVYPPLNPQFFCEIVPFTLKPPPQLRAVKNSGYYKGCKSLLGTFVDRGSLKSFVPWK
ncbi:alpha-(1,3)-fucosyltransferase 6-like [Acanthaster planci]|uniref:Fucosyltransferase n=1 Tax=Acanthaster planci TaxID=133434 RepID=A0A8B7YPU9_ACAPL|nr:alpha-(1,3)-fucosyltransferase 6-like [Acanthaster planci]